MSQGLAEMQKLQHRVAAVRHQYQIALGQPTAQLNNHLAGSVRKPLMGPAQALQALIVALRGSQDGQHRQRPGAAGPGDVDQVHQADPAQAAGLDEVTFAGAHGIPVDAFGRNSLASSTLQGLVNAKHQRSACRVQVAKQQVQQHLAQLQRRPASAVEDMVVLGKASVMAQAHGSQCRCYGSLTGCQNYSHQQYWYLLPGPALKQRGKGCEYRYNGSGQCKHNLAFRRG